MKRIALVVAAGLLLVAPVVFAQSAPRPLPPLSATTVETSSRDTVLYVPPSDDAPARPKSGVQNTCIPPDASTVTASLEDGTETTVTATLEDGTETTVTGSCEDPTTY
jgi:hypothetical protein